MNEPSAKRLNLGGPGGPDDTPSDWKIVDVGKNRVAVAFSSTGHLWVKVDHGAGWSLARATALGGLGDL